MKQAYSILLLFILSWNLTACANLPASTHITAVTPKDSDSISGTYQKAAVDTEGQNKLIMEESDSWSHDFDSLTWYYTFSDMDHNGLLEVITARKPEGEEGAAFICREVTKNLKSLEICTNNIDFSFPCPDLTAESTDCYYDEDSELYYYVYENEEAESASRTTHTKSAIYLENKEINYISLATFSESLQEDQTVKQVYKDSEGNLIDETSYHNAGDIYFKGFEKSAADFEWFEMTNEEEPDAEEEDASPEPSSSPDTADIEITKNPSGECLNVGGGTYFIAHADHADSITWLFKDPQNKEYSLEEASAQNEGLVLEMLPGDTLSVSNVPLSLNNWSIVARFAAGDATKDTAPARLVIADFLSLYAEVMDSYTDYMHGRAEQGTVKTVYTLEPDHRTDGDSSITAISAYADRFRYVGYYFKDINKDSVPELLISGANDTGEDPTGVILDLFTMRNGKIIRIAASGENSVYSFCADSRIAYHLKEDSGTTDLLLNFNGRSLEIEEGISTAENAAKTGFVYFRGNISEDGSFAFEERISAAVYEEALARFTGNPVNIPFTKFL